MKHEYACDNKGAGSNDEGLVLGEKAVLTGVMSERNERERRPG